MKEDSGRKKKNVEADKKRGGRNVKPNSSCKEGNENAFV